MASTFYFRQNASTLGGAGQLALLQRSARVNQTAVTTTTAGGTSIQVTQTAGGQVLVWFSEPITEAVTISGTITVNLWGAESANTVNAGSGLLIERTNNAGVVQSTIVNTATTTEWSTAAAAKSSSNTPTSTAMSVGDRIKATLTVRNVGTMGAGSVTNYYAGPTTGATGDTYVRFTEDIRTDDIIDVPANEIWGMNAYYG